MTVKTIQNLSRLLGIFLFIQGKRMNHKYVFVNNSSYNHDKENLTKNRPEAKNGLNVNRQE